MVLNENDELDHYFAEQCIFEAFKLGRQFQERFYDRDLEINVDKIFPDN